MTNKTFKESQPEGALKGSFFDKVPDAYQVSNYLKGKKNKGDKKVNTKNKSGGNKTKKDSFKTMPEKFASTMREIARKDRFKTMPEKFAGTMKKISDDDKIIKPTAKPDSVKKKAKKAPIVTPKMLKDAGFPNNAGGLRDYMNFKSGKTRKGGGKAVRTEAFKKKNPAGVMGDSFKGGGSVKKIKYRGGGIVKQSVRPTRYI